MRTHIVIIFAVCTVLTPLKANSQRFPAGDGCNTCATEGGITTCTALFCGVAQAKPVLQGNSCSQFCALQGDYMVCNMAAMASCEKAKGAAAPKPKQHHALTKIALFPVKCVKATAGHPKRSLKDIYGSFLFAAETVDDGARLGFEGADKTFTVLSFHGKAPVLDQISMFVHVGALDTAKWDVKLEAAEQRQFGRHN